MTDKEAIEKIIESCEVLKWQIAIHQGHENSKVVGMIIGEDSYIEEILKGD